jgi:1-acyl-sn-glycerol-3-phosphate acyltransferase
VTTLLATHGDSDARVAKSYGWARAIFDWFLRRMARADFHAVRVIGQCPTIPPGDRAIFVANHCGWWDGLLLLLLQRRFLPSLPVYSVMLAREFSATFWFKLIGCMPITPGSTGSIRQLLRRLAALNHELAKSGYICSYFPQGEIRPSFLRPLNFTSGLRAVANAMAPVTLIPVAFHYEPMTQRKPEALIAFGTPIKHTSGPLDVARVETAVTSALDGIQSELMSHGEHLFCEGRGPAYVNLV